MMLIKTNELGKDFESKPYFDIHDELVFTVKKKEEKEYLSKVIIPAYDSLHEEVMRWFGVELPLKFRYKIKIGPSYGQLEEVNLN